MSAGVSIILCCYNSASRIEPTLVHIAAQSFAPNIAAEVILVDNNSTDNTAELATRKWAEIGSNVSIRFRQLREEKQGLVFARIAGVMAAQYDYIVFCDDDNWLTTDYCSRVMHFFDHHPDFGLLGGFCIAVSSISLPDWFEKKHNAYACGHQYYHSGEVTGIAFLWGAGLAARKHLLEKLYSPQVPVLLTGRTGTALISGDDDEINGRVWLLGAKSYYDETLCLQHFIEPARLHIDYPETIINNFKNQGALRGSYFRMYRIQTMNSLNKAITFSKALVNWIFYSLRSAHEKKRVAASYLFLISGIKNFGGLVDHNVYRFTKEVVDS